MEPEDWVEGDDLSSFVKSLGLDEGLSDVELDAILDQVMTSEGVNMVVLAEHACDPFCAFRANWMWN